MKNVVPNRFETTDFMHSTVDLALHDAQVLVFSVGLVVVP
jgi:hypothetical protein